jgi:hypothetical protein
MQIIITFIAGLAILLFISFLLAWPVMILWNACLIPAFPEIILPIGWMQAWGISILCGILFKNNNSK